MVLLVASLSSARAVMPARLPMPAVSFSRLALLSMSASALVSNSSLSLTATVKARVRLLPSLDVARTTMLWLAAVSRSMAPATRTTPLAASMLKRPPALSVRL